MSQEKTEKPTARKLRKARKRGEVAKSRDVTQTAEFAVLLALLVLGLPFFATHVADLTTDALTLVGRVGEQPQAHLAMASAAVDMFVIAVAACLGPGVFVATLAAFLQVRNVFSVDPVLPKFERLNPGTNLQRLVSSRTMFDLAKTLLKIVLLLSVIGITVAKSTAAMMNAQLIRPAELFAAAGEAAAYAGAAALAIYILMAAVDYGHQHYEFMKQQRMSKDELRREYREMEGDPLIRGHRRSWHRSLAMSSRQTSLARASVVVTNPTRLAVAIGYESGSGGLPYVIAKGEGTGAAEIRRAAAAARVPIVENKPLARRLYDVVPEGAYIVADTFADVARLLAMAYRRDDSSVYLSRL